MSRIGKHAVVVPAGVDVALDGQTVSVKGKLGALSVTLPDEVEVAKNDNKVQVSARSSEQRARAMWGMSRSLLQNMVVGVTQGFTTKLEINGVGYRAAVEGKVLTLQLGYSHDIKFAIPDDVKIVCETPTAITLTGADKQRVGQIAAELRSFRKPEPYKGKGIKYATETVRRKEGKKK
ncbi:MAG: 50S ribosomal protein L6 [Geminicoccaceae bacterium]